MTDEQIQSKAREFIAGLTEIETELKTLKHRIEVVKEKAERVKTVADAEAFDEWYSRNLPDQGLELIEVNGL